MAKRKDTNLKRIVAKSGQIYYYKNGKRISEKKGASEFVRTYFSQIDPNKLSKQELQSFRGRVSAEEGKSKIKSNASERLRFKGRFVPKYLQTFLVEQKLVSPKEKEITREFPAVRSYGDFLKEVKDFVPKKAFIKQSEWGLINEKRNRSTFESMIDIAENLTQDPLFSKLQLVVITEDGKIINDKIKALEAIRDWEIQQIDDTMAAGGNAAYTKFSHFGHIDITNGKFIIDLSESTQDTSYS